MDAVYVLKKNSHSVSELMAGMTCPGIQEMNKMVDEQCVNLGSATVSCSSYQILLQDSSCHGISSEQMMHLGK